MVSWAEACIVLAPFGLDVRFRSNAAFAAWKKSDDPRAARYRAWVAAGRPLDPDWAAGV
jgi:hypothetical protein